MRRATTAGSGLLSIALLLGCDGGKEPLARGADAEARGSFAEAAALYRTACDKSSALCPIATKRAERLKLAEAAKALDEGQYKKAAEALDLALASSDPGVKRGAEAMRKLPDLEKGLLWEEASTLPSQDEALARMETLAEAGVAASPRAKEWLDKNAPRILLERVKAACRPDGSGSCVEAGRALARLRPASPEDVEAQRLVEAEYARAYPLLQKAESLLALWVGVWDEIETCEVRKQADLPHWSNVNVYESCKAEVYARGQKKENEEGKPEGDTEAAPPVDLITKEWTAKLGEIHDPFLVKPLEERWARVEKACTNELDCGYDAAPLRKPVKQK